MSALHLVMAFVFVGVLFVALQSSRKQTAARESAWSAFGRQRGLAYTAGDFLRPPRLEGRIDGVRVAIERQTETTTDSDGDSRQEVFTKVVADTSSSPHLRVKVYAEHALSGLGKFLGFQDVELGDTKFDDTFVVKASIAAGARELLDDELRRRMLAFGDRLLFVYEDDRVSLRWPGEEVDPYVLADALDLVVRAAQFGASDDRSPRVARPRRRAQVARSDDSTEERSADQSVATDDAPRGPRRRRKKTGD